MSCCSFHYFRFSLCSLIILCIIICIFIIVYNLQPYFVTLYISNICFIYLESRCSSHFCCAKKIICSRSREMTKLSRSKYKHYYNRVLLSKHSCNGHNYAYTRIPNPSINDFYIYDYRLL